TRRLASGSPPSRPHPGPGPGLRLRRAAPCPPGLADAQDDVQREERDGDRDERAGLLVRRVVREGGLADQPGHRGQGGAKEDEGRGHDGAFECGRPPLSCDRTVVMSGPRTVPDRMTPRTTPTRRCHSSAAVYRTMAHSTTTIRATGASWASCMAGSS